MVSIKQTDGNVAHHHGQYPQHVSQCGAECAEAAQLWALMAPVTVAAAAIGLFPSSSQ